MTVLSNIITPSNVLTTTNTATVTNKTLTAPTVTGMVVSDGTANGVTYLNGSKVLTSGSALVFNGTNLGVGVTPATWFSDYRVIQLADGTSLSGRTGNADRMQLMANVYRDAGGDYRYITSNFATQYFQGTGQHIWYTAASGTAGNTISFTQAMTLDASGNLGIGTTSPSSFDGSADNLVVGTTSGNNGITIAAGTASASTINFADGTAGGAQYTGYIDYQHSGDYMRFGTNGGNERMRIDSSGNLLVGTTSGTRHILKKNATGDDAAQIENSASATPYGLFIYFSGAAPNDATRYFIAGQDTSAARFQLRSNGGLGNYSANNVNLSDRREKTNFAPATSYLDKICAIPVQTFNYIDQNMEDDGGLTLGVVAQDVQAVAPELVLESNWAGKDQEPKMRLSIYQTDLQYALMKCIQEQQALIQSLKARLDAANL